MTLGSRVKELRKGKDLTQTELGKLVGVSYQNIQNVEGGSVNNPRYLLELAKALNTTTDYLLNGNNKGHDPSAVNSDLLGMCMDEVLNQAKLSGQQLSSQQAAKLTAYIYAQTTKNANKEINKGDIHNLITLINVA